MGTKALLLFAVIFGVFISILPSARAEEILTLGEQKSVSVEAGTRYSVGNLEVLEVKNTEMPDGRIMLLVKGRGLGYSDLLLFSPSAGQKSMSFRVLTRKAPLPVAKIGKTTDSFTRLKIQKNINSQLKTAGLGHLRVRLVGEGLLLEGVAHTKSEKEIGEILAKEIFPGVRSYVALPFDSKDILKFKVQILELVKSKEEKHGLEWSEGIPSILQLHQGILKGNISLDASLHALSKSGLVKILSEPELALNSEGVAQLKVGGEIPIPLKSLHFSSVQWKSYGLSLRLEVPGVGENNARTNIQVEISTLDTANGIDGIPATKLNHLETVVDLPLDKPIFLSGLMQDQADLNIAGVPGLSSIPILGALFQSKNFQEQRSELVIALTAKRGVY